MEEFNAQNLSSLKTEINQAIKTIATNRNIKIQVGRIKYAGDEAQILIRATPMI